ncbi:hypothetical protein [Sphingomonas sp. LT1P40]|uniref:hypothetical protein n=1 Tax=Alteristakelama amylovorans TaxID=3096166 RepID=UPI002FCB3CA6
MTYASITSPQTAHAELDGKRVHTAADLRVTPLGLLAIGALVAGILLCVPPIIRATAKARRAPS